jgi:catechol 2,3-dioxygenase-like lactoylglutathione lyase family enzyme
MITGIHHVSIKCGSAEDFKKTTAFYTEILGMKVLRSWGEGKDAGVMLTISGSDILEIFASGQESVGNGSVNHFAFYTDDPDKCIEKVRNAGYEITEEPDNVDLILKQPIPGNVYPLRVAFCTGPAGESIEFFSERI